MQWFIVSNSAPFFELPIDTGVIDPNEEIIQKSKRYWCPLVVQKTGRVTIDGQSDCCIIDKTLGLEFASRFIILKIDRS